MKTPAFFDAVAPIAITDPLAALLGATEGGRIEYRYLDAVKLAGANLMHDALEPHADAATREAFAAVWQEWVRTILIDHADDPRLIAAQVDIAVYREDLIGKAVN